MPSTPLTDPDSYGCAMTPDPVAPPLVGTVALHVERTTPVFALAPPGGVTLYVGTGDVVEQTPVVVTASSPAALTHWLTRAITAVVTVAPESDPDPGPDPLVVEALRILQEDVMRLLGSHRLASPPAIPVEELSIDDVRAARTLLQRAEDLLAATVGAEDPTTGTPRAA